MPDLSCSVLTCAYNKTQRCCKENIKVEGNNAKITEQTSCGSFRLMDGSSAVNMAMEAKVNTRIACDVTACAYNEDHRCKAEHIGIVGKNAEAPAQTECSTFECR